MRWYINSSLFQLWSIEKCKWKEKKTTLLVDKCIISYFFNYRDRPPIRSLCALHLIMILLCWCVAHSMAVWPFTSGASLGAWALGAWLPRSLGAGRLAAWELGDWLPGSLGAGRMAAWELSCLGAWLSGSLAAWELGSLEAWLSGSSAAWGLGCRERRAILLKFLNQC